MPHISAIPSRLFLIFCAILNIEKTNENMLISFTNAYHGLPTRLRGGTLLGPFKAVGEFVSCGQGRELGACERLIFPGFILLGGSSGALLVEGGFAVLRGLLIVSE